MPEKNQLTEKKKEQIAADIFSLMLAELDPGSDTEVETIILASNQNVLSQESLEMFRYTNSCARTPVTEIACPVCMLHLSRESELEIRVCDTVRLARIGDNIFSPFDGEYIKRERGGDARTAFYKGTTDYIFSANIGDNGEAWTYNPKAFYWEAEVYRWIGEKGSYKHKLATSWPMTLSDLAWVFHAWPQTEHSPLYLTRKVIHALIRAWGENSLLWKDILHDLENGSSYASIPVTKIYGCHSRRELIGNYCGEKYAGRRTNKDNIGQSIFYARAHMLIAENEIQKLYGYDPVGYKITNSRMSLVEPLAKAMHELLLERAGTDVTKRGRYEVLVDESLIEDAIRNTIRLREKVSLSFNSPAALLEWHDRQANRVRDRDVEKVRIPKDSKFRKLKMPDNCVRLKSKRALIEEGNYQNNCVATYAEEINRDISSIWSMRLDDGTRYTIEICVDWRANAFYIEQMLGWGNSDCDDEYYDLVEKCIADQVPCRNPYRE